MNAMPKQMTRYSLQLSPIELSSQSDCGVLEMEIVAQPETRLLELESFPQLRDHF